MVTAEPTLPDRVSIISFYELSSREARICTRASQKELVIFARGMFVAHRVGRGSSIQSSRQRHVDIESELFFEALYHTCYRPLSPHS